MQKSKILTIILVLAGLAGIVVGAGSLFAPVAFHASSGIVLDGESTNLLNELRAASGALFVGGLLILSGAFVTRLAFTATLFAAVLYLSYGGGRLVSVAIDGMPAPALLQIAGFEIITGLICLFALIRYRQPS